MGDNVNSSRSCDSIKIRIAESVSVIVLKLLPDLRKFLSRVLDDSTMSAPLVVFQNEKLKQKLKSLLILLRDDFCSACESLSKYATDETVYGEIKEDLCRQRVKNLFNYLKVCNERFNTMSENYIRFFHALNSMEKDLKELIEQHSTTKGSKESQAKFSKGAYVVGALGFTALVGAGVVFLSPLVVPVATLGVASAAGGAVGFTGVLAGSLLRQPHEKEDIKLLSDAINQLLGYQKCLPNVMSQSHNTAQAAMNNIKSCAFVATQSHQMLDEDKQVKVLETRVIVDESTLLLMCRENQTSITFVLEEFKEHMTKLKEHITEEKATIRAILQKLS